MGRKAPWQDIPDSAVVPDGVYHLAVEEIEESQSSERTGGKLMYELTVRIVEPRAFVNLPLYNNFVVGSDDDPNADDPETWKASVGAKNLKRFFAATQVEFMDDMAPMCEASRDQEFLALVTRTTQEKGDFKGREQNNFNGGFKRGEREGGVRPPDQVPGQRRRRGAAAAAPIVSAPPVPALSPAPRRPVAPAPGPAAPRRPAAAPATVPCALCGVAIPREAFLAHADTCQGPQV